VPNSIVHVIFALSLVIPATAAMPTGNTDDGAPAESQNAPSTAGPETAGPGLPADFPLAPGLSACQPIVISTEIICEWHGVDGHAIYAFYHEALPKAGYTLLPGASEAPQPSYRGAMGFKKGPSQGAVSITGDDLTIQIITGA
jgi:hypothetical protein